MLEGQHVAGVRAYACGGEDGQTWAWAGAAGCQTGAVPGRPTQGERKPLTAVDDAERGQRQYGQHTQEGGEKERESHPPPLMMLREGIGSTGSTERNDGRGKKEAGAQGASQATHRR